MISTTRRTALGLGLGATSSLILPRFAIAQADTRPSITIAVQKISNSNTLDVLREQSNVGERIFFSSIWEGLIGRDWLNGLKDTVTRMRLIKRLQRAGLGNLGDVKPVGEGVYEMREFFGPGWRMYYVQQGDVLLIMLGGGDKSSQQRDIERAIQLSKEL